MRSRWSAAGRFACRAWRSTDRSRRLEFPLHLNWSDRGRQYDLRDRRHRARVYELVLREGGPDDVLTYVDGALLLDVWDDLVLPAKVRAALARVFIGRTVDEVA